MKRVDSTRYTEFIAEHIIELDCCMGSTWFGWKNRHTNQVEAKRYIEQGQTIYEIKEE